MRRWLAALWLGIVLVIPGPASAAAVEDLAAGVPGMVGKTWLDLLRQVFPDLAESPKTHVPGVASELIELRSIGMGDESWIQCGDNIELQSIGATAVRLGGGPRLVVSVEMADDCVGVVALFDGEGKLVDAVNVKGDQHVSFSGDDVRPLGPDGALVIATNWHDNSDQSYDVASLILARAGGLSSIGDVLAFGSRSCRDQFTEETKISVAPNTGAMSRIDAEIRRRFHKFAADCETVSGRDVTTVFNGYWRWDARKGSYVPHTKELDLLSGWNEKHF